EFDAPPLGIIRVRAADDAADFVEVPTGDPQLTVHGCCGPAACKPVRCRNGIAAAAPEGFTVPVSADTVQLFADPEVADIQLAFIHDGKHGLMALAVGSKGECCEQQE